MIYTITLTNKETGREINRDYDLHKLRISDRKLTNAIDEMRLILEDNQDKF